MQRGFATLEIIFATMIIVVLVTCTLPNVEHAVDRVALDYETKRLYSEMRFLQAINRSGKFNVKGTGRNDLSTTATDAPFMEIAPENCSYQILRGNTAIREAHHMQNIKSIDTPKDTVTFDDTGQSNIVSDSIILTSRLGKQSKIIFDSVGRIRGGRDNE